jgi:hypothetical protein
MVRHGHLEKRFLPILRCIRGHAYMDAIRAGVVAVFLALFLRRLQGRP